MEKLPMCRICLAENVSMYVVVNRNLHKVYEKLTDIPFVTEDRRPILVCFFCCEKLKQSYKLLRQCLKAEELFIQRMNEDYEPDPLMKQNHLEFFNGLINSPIVHMSINEECERESITVKDELPAVCEDIIVVKEEHQTEELEAESVDNSYLDIADIPPHHSEADSEDDVPLLTFKPKVEEEQEVLNKIQRPTETIRATVAKKPKHTRIHPSEKPYKCNLCERSFSLNGNLKNHIRTHNDEKPHKCVFCQSSFSKKSKLTNHISVHTGEKRYKCEVCQRCFNYKCNLSQHIRTHTGEKPYKCDVCKRSFSLNAHLTKHMRIHTGERPYKCHLCERSFRRNDHLANHVRIHNGEKPHKCDSCERSFRRNDHLANHIRIHNGEKPHKCDFCQSSFNKKTGLTNHIRTHAGENLSNVI